MDAARTSVWESAPPPAPTLKLDYSASPCVSLSLGVSESVSSEAGGGPSMRSTCDSRALLSLSGSLHGLSQLEVMEPGAGEPGAGPGLLAPRVGDVALQPRRPFRFSVTTRHCETGPFFISIPPTGLR